VPHQPLRIVDANLNRSAEGLRVLEDVARFILDDADLSRRLRTVRHRLTRAGSSLGTALLSERDSEHDAGRENLPGKSYPDLISLVEANASRVEESLRVLEELARLDELSATLDAAAFEQARFTLYPVEKEMVSRLSRQDKLRQLTGLYVILDRQALAGRDELELARETIQGGAKVIQLRDKQSSAGELLPLALRLKELCFKSGVLLIINDYLDLALAAGADGVHLGPMDLPPAVARRELPLDRLIGCSVTTVSGAVRAKKEGADYISVGSMFPTGNKKSAVVVGLERLKKVKEAVSPPVVAIGGIDESNVGEVIAAGADCIAVIDAVLGKPDARKAARQLLRQIRKAKRKCPKMS
jgi:thiamine-phosphate pyrophosphorylase